MSANPFIEKLDAGMREYVERFGLPGDPDVDVDTMRRQYRELCLSLRAPRPANVEVADESVAADHGAIPVRRYTPHDASAGTVLYAHGGGWVVGDLDTHDDVCAEIAVNTRAQVIAIDYRMAPEHPYPAAFDDVLRVFEAARGAGDEPIVACGDSAGGNLAAALAIKVRDARLGALAGQVLIYPVCTLRQTLPAYRELRDAPLLTADKMAWYVDTYLAGGEADVYADPLLAGNLSGVAPMFAVAAEFDPLRDDALVFDQRLRADGVASETWLARGLAHGFLRVRHTSAAAADAFDRSCAAVSGFLAAARS